MLCIFSLPGESASRDRVVTTPYTTAHAAQTSATTTPWFVRKLLNRNPPRSDLRAARGCVARTSDGRIAQGELLSAANAGAVYRAGRRGAGRRTPIRRTAAVALTVRAPTACRSTPPVPDRGAARRRPALSPLPRCSPRRQRPARPTAQRRWA